MKQFIFIISCFIGLQSIAQTTLSLDDCYELLNKNYPLAAQQDLLNRQKKLNINAVKKLSLPQINLAAKSTYQSDVTFLEVPLPGVNITKPNKYQYSATLTANQLIYQGGLINTQAKVKNLEARVKQSAVKVSLYNLKQKVNQFYFSILLQDKKKNLALEKQKELQSRLSEVNSAIKNGASLPSSNALLEAELLNVKQQLFEIVSTKNALLKVLAELIGKSLPENVVLKQPKVLIKNSTTINRPELNYFNLQKQEISLKNSLLNKSNMPKITAFAKGGYGNPGFNLLDNNFVGYYMVGLQLNWYIFDWHKNKEEQQSMAINSQIIDTKKDVFKLNTNLETINQLAEINTLNRLLKTDKQIIILRIKVLKTAKAQLKNGVITPSDYITELTRLYQAKTNLKTHKIKLEWAKINYLTTTGNYENKH